MAGSEAEIHRLANTPGSDSDVRARAPLKNAHPIRVFLLAEVYPMVVRVPRHAEDAAASACSASKKASVSAAVCLALYGVPCHVAAQQTAIDRTEASAAAQTPEKAIEINLQSGSLADALEKLGDQSGLQILYEPALARGIQVDAVRGTITVNDALNRLLAHSGLRAERVNAKTVVLKRAAPKRGSSEQTQDPSSTRTSRETEAPSDTLQEVTVTAQRREQKLEAVSYSISVVSADQIARTGVTDVVSLARQVPGLSMPDYGPSASATVFPVIRGINASVPLVGGFRTFEQIPVGMYLDNSPVDGYFQLDDVQRVEVLRGPQGTLYGAGALGGALRIIPNKPNLEKFGASIEVGGGSLSHSSGASYTVSGMLNVPLADTIAFRASGKYDHEPGFVNVYGILERPNSPLYGIPVLANPADPVNSPGVYTGKKDWNDANAFTGRASLLWEPTEEFSAQTAFTYARTSGDGSPGSQPYFQGGAYPPNPRITFPAGGPYQEFTAVDQPYSFHTTLTSLDLSYDAGFATLSSTSSYLTTSGSDMVDDTYAVFGICSGCVASYYAGNPANPRFVAPVQYAVSKRTFTQEVRLVSKTGPDSIFDYVAGVFYERQTSNGSFTVTTPGTPQYSAAEGCTAPFVYPGDLPNCLTGTGPDGLVYYQPDAQRFEDKSIFGEFTWHVVSHGQITVGLRHFDQSFTDEQGIISYPFQINSPPVPHSQPASRNTWKVNPSYQYLTDQYVYALWSQGFRRGGANSIPFAGAFGESNQALLSYTPDSTNNYEVGFKGRLSNDISYTFDLFDIEWNKPQIETLSPVGNYIVYNAPKARSRGVEFDLHAPLFLSGLSITASGAYIDAKLTQGYDIPADQNGSLIGQAGQQLPGSPKTSAAATIDYQRNLLGGYELALSLNDTYRSSVPFGQSTSAPAMNLVNLSTSIGHGSWRLGAYVTNLADKYAIQLPHSNTPQLAGLFNGTNLINRPREISLRLRYSY